MSGLGHGKGTQGTPAQKPRRQVLKFLSTSVDPTEIVLSSAQHSCLPSQSKTDRIELRHSHKRSFCPQVAAHHLGNVGSCSACVKEYTYTCSNCTCVYYIYILIRKKEHPVSNRRLLKGWRARTLPEPSKSSGSVTSFCFPRFSLREVVVRTSVRLCVCVCDLSDQINSFKLRII